MEFTEEAAADLGAVIGIAVSYIFVAAFNTIVSKVISGAFSLFLRHVLLQKRIFIYPAMWIHVTLFCTMPDTLE
jgi:large-conductance mechanosensitive channel